MVLVTGHRVEVRGDRSGGEQWQPPGLCLPPPSTALSPLPSVILSLSWAVPAWGGRRQMALDRKRWLMAQQQQEQVHEGPGSRGPSRDREEMGREDRSPQSYYLVNVVVCWELESL